MPQESILPPQHQERQPGLETEMRPRPKEDDGAYRPASKLRDKVAIITGGDSGIGRAVAIAYAKEGADVVIVYLNEHEDAEESRRRVEKYERRPLTMAGDVGDENFCREAVDRTMREFGRVDVLVNQEISAEQLLRTFRTNVFAMFYLTTAALPHMKSGGAIINTTSVTAYQGNPRLIDYASSK